MGVVHHIHRGIFDRVSSYDLGDAQVIYELWDHDVGTFIAKFYIESDMKELVTQLLEHHKPGQENVLTVNFLKRGEQIKSLSGKSLLEWVESGTIITIGECSNEE